MRADDIRQRIETAYMAITLERTPHGALSWFARLAHVRRQTVSAWVNGKAQPSGPAIGLLEALEREAKR